MADLGRDSRQPQQPSAPTTDGTAPTTDGTASTDRANVGRDYRRYDGCARNPCKRSCFESDVRRREHSCGREDEDGDIPFGCRDGAWTFEEEYATCKRFFHECWEGERCWGDGDCYDCDRHTCVRDPLNNGAIWAREKDGKFVSEDTWINNEHQEFLKQCFACVDDGKVWDYTRHGRKNQDTTTTCISHKEAEEKRKAEEAEEKRKAAEAEKKRRCAEEQTQCFTDPKRQCDEQHAACLAPPKRQCDEQHTQCLAQPALGSSLGIDGVHTTSFALGALMACTLGVLAYLVRRSRVTKITDSSAYGATTAK